MEICNNFQKTNSLKKEKGLNFKNKTNHIKQMTETGLKVASTAIASFGLASIALRQNSKSTEVNIYEECSEITQAMARFTPEELQMFSESKNYKNIEILSTLKFKNLDGKEEYRFSAQEILEYADLENFADFNVLAETTYIDKQTKRYCSRYTNADLKGFVENNVNFKLATEYSSVLVNSGTNNVKFPFWPSICSYIHKYEQNAQIIKNEIKNINDDKLRFIFELQYKNLVSLPIEERVDEQIFMLKKIDAYNNLTNKYVTYKQIGDKRNPKWLDFIKYCKEKNIEINDSNKKRHLYLDFLEQQKVESLIEACKDRLSSTFEFCSKYPDTALNYMYENIYLNSLPESILISTANKELLKRINKEYNTKIFLPVSAFNQDKVEYIENELKKWHNASNGRAKYPPTLNLLRSKRNYIDDKSAYGTSKSSGYCYPSTSGAIAINGYENIEYALRHELMHTNDWKLLEKFSENWYETDGKTVKQEIKNKFYNEFRKGNLNINKSHFEYAFNNPQEFIAVASEGYISNYSSWFLEQLIEFGMPIWSVKLSQ